MLTVATRIEMDPSKVSLPTFVLEPRSMLERITDFMSHPDLVFGYVLPCEPTSPPKLFLARMQRPTLRRDSFEC